MAELTSSTREAARRLGVSDTTMHKAERTGRITREPDGQWDITKTRARLLDTADPQRSQLSGSAAAEGTPFARLKVAQLALKVEAQRLALDESKGRLLDVATANATIDEIASTMRDALLNWPARVAGVIAAELGVEPHLLQTILQQHINELLTEASNRKPIAAQCRLQQPFGPKSRSALPYGASSPLAFWALAPSPSPLSVVRVQRPQASLAAPCRLQR